MAVGVLREIPFSVKDLNGNFLISQLAFSFPELLFIHSY